MVSTRPGWMEYLKLLTLMGDSFMNFMPRLLEYSHITAMSPRLRSIFRVGYMVYTSSIPRPLGQADEMVMIMNGFDTDFDTENNFYSVNTIPYYYMHHPIEIEEGKLVRVYLVNMLEFDQINNFHLR